ncbi:hypothetical protein M430DRAFT_220938 [Amorphotheca resinae ATCC 22711]|uniref:Uncharacterized protein n=1 Tax=Amorphotheca resinae ATCC 22711 TaxID=857342 RepID=A0A2T3B5R6_AMORE|nr:hypothetical protein M430DRAFT_220938 [Amorphotheca resinae ATCC 22711]PSS22086.1 hypothetical protein M430DRAFT_220938 [Amorphotheca resinae ATCC 22711]
MCRRQLGNVSLLWLRRLAHGPGARADMKGSVVRALPLTSQAIRWRVSRQVSYVLCTAYTTHIGRGGRKGVEV